MTAGPLTLEDLERLIRWGERCDVVEALRATHEALRSVMADRDRAESHAKRAETLAHDLQAQVLALRSLFVNWRWDGPAWIKPEEHRAMEEATRLAGGKPLDK